MTRVTTTPRLETFGYKIYSQSDEDGILAHIFDVIGTTNKLFVEIGVEVGIECNTQLLLERGWRGLWIEGNPEYAKAILHREAERLKSGQLKFVSEYVTASNVNDLIRKIGVEGDVDLFSLDIDSNDYHVFEALEVIQPRVLVLEHNPHFPPPQKYVMARDDQYRWHGDTAFGASLTSTAELAREKGYTLVGCGAYSPNGFYVRSDLVGDRFEGPFTAEHMWNGFDYDKIVSYPRRLSVSRSNGALPIHFFTIVLNGEPFIRYHERMLGRLHVPWHWHIVEGVAALNHDTSWSVATGGHVADALHDRGRSNDGTSAYLDELAARYPENVTIYRKLPGEFWDGKREMVNAPLANIDKECLLWQMDSDELWTADQIHAVHEQFTLHPDRTAAWYWCWYYVGPGKIISTRYNYAQDPRQEWLRTWRFRPGARWAAHEPPQLVLSGGADGRDVDLGRLNPFSHDEMEAVGAIFHHFAYATEAQLAFKEIYYGYADARSHWRKLVDRQGSGRLRDYFDWVKDEAMFDDAAFYLVDPLAHVGGHGTGAGRWDFAGRGRLTTSEAAMASVPRPRIALDGIFWQHLSSGIARLWENVLREWAASGFAEHVVVLDRAGTAPRIPGIHYWSIAAHDYGQTGRDSLYLDEVCRALGVDLFVSTYYSTPTRTPSFFAGYDMIPEVLGTPQREETWKEKHRAIRHASAHAMISRNSADDLERLFPEVARGGTYVAHLGVDPQLGRPSDDAGALFRSALGLEGKEYVLFVGERVGYGDYKNAALAFRALGAMPEGRRPVLVCVRGQPELEQHLRDLAPGLDARRITLDDAELAAAYAGAYALLYPSKYEGFGLPPLEAMACGTPVIVCRNSSIPEVVGDAAIFVDEDDPAEMVRALEDLRDASRRADLVARGRTQAARFTFAETAESLANALTETAGRLASGEVAPPSPAWDELRRFQRQVQGGVPGTYRTPGRGVLSVPSPAHDDPEQLRLQMAAMQRSPFWRARNLSVRLLRRLGLRDRS